jgi:hypothetical protein
MAGYEEWKVSSTKPVMYGSGPVGQGSGYGFSIQDRRGAPLLSISFATAGDAEEAEVAVREALAKAVYIER